ncbi:MAG: hypothetical protein CSA24_02540 [Deltaproteobacteria bacterium]|nr:MAG: hypothetical protein CSA24_02540 [Deltaproteobacteria bacterium]
MATAVTAILGTLSYGVMMTAISTQEDALIVQERYHAGRIALERMRRELTMAFVSLHQAEDARTVTLFEGEDDRLVFNTGAHEPLKRNVRQSDQLEVEYFTKSVETEAGDKVDALMRRVKFHIDDRPGKGGREDILVEGVRKLELEYFDEYAEDWRDEWTVRIDDAIEMRQRLKEVQAVRDQLDDARNDGGASVAGAAVTALAAEAIDREVDSVELELMEGLFLPARVRIHLVLVDNDDNEFHMETQVEIPMVEPLWY